MTVVERRHQKSRGPIWPSGSLRCSDCLRQVKKGTDIPRAGAPVGATIRSSMAAVLAEKFVVICAKRLLVWCWRGEREGGWYGPYGGMSNRFRYAAVSA